MAAEDQGLYGRDEELQAIAALLDALPDTDTGGLSLQIAGEPGIGKSRLLDKLCRQARSRGHLVLSGRAAEFEGELPFGLFGDAMDDWLLRLPSARLASLAGDLAAELAVVLPTFETLGCDRRAELQEERYRSYRAMRVLLCTVAEEAPVVLALDDLQYSGSAGPRPCSSATSRRSRTASASSTWPARPATVRRCS